MEIEIYGDSIKLSQLLKKLDIVASGGKAKFFVKSHVIKINGKIAEGRNSKVHVGDVIWIDDNVYKLVAAKQKQEN